VADSSVLLEVIVEGKNIKIVQRQVEELGASINKASEAEEKQVKQKKKNKKATDDLDASTRNYNRGQKGVAGATANGTKAFSKQRDAIGSGSSGLVGAYATIAANLFAATAAFGALRRAAQIETLIEGVTALGAASGQNIPLLAESLKEATGAAISLDQALRTASFASSSGFDANQIEQLAEVGKKAAIALGRDVGDAVDRLTRGVAKLEPEILDELGIIVRLDDATASYAAQIGKTVGQLTAFERQQAFANATIEQGLSKFGDIDVDPNPYDQLAASLQDLANSFLKIVNTVLGPLVSILAENKAVLLGFILVLTKGVAAQAASAFGSLSKSAAESAQKTADAARKAGKAQKKAFKETQKELKKIPEELGKVAKEYSELASQAKSYDALIEQEKELTRTIEKRTKALGNANRTQKGIEKSKKDISELTGLRGRIREEIGKGKGPSIDPELAKTLSVIAKKQANIFEELDENPSFENFKNKFKEANVLGKEYSDTLRNSGKANMSFLTNLPIIGKFLGGISKGLTAGTLAWARFGIAGKVALRGIIYAVPIIGQVVLALSIGLELVISVFKKIIALLPEAKKLEKAQESIVASTETLKDVTKAYEKALVSTTLKQYEYVTVLEETLTAEEKLTIERQLRVEAVKAELTLIEAQASAIKSTLKALQDFDREQRLVASNTTIIGSLWNSLVRSFESGGYRISRAFGNIALGLRKMGSDINQLFADLAISDATGELTLFAKFFGITEAEIAATTHQASLLSEELSRAFNAAEADIFFKAGAEGARSFLEIFENNADAARALNDAILGVGKDIDPKAISQNIAKAFEDVDATGLSETVKQAAQAADVDRSGSLDTEAEKRAFILKLLQDSTGELVALGESSQNISSSIDGASDSLSNFITKLSQSKSSVSDIAPRISTIAIELNKSGLSAEQLAAKIDELPTAFKELLNLSNMTGEQQVESINNFDKLLRKVTELELTEKRRLNTLKATNAVLKTAGTLNIEAYQAILNYENQIAQIQKDRVTEQITLAKMEFDRQKRAYDLAVQTAKNNSESAPPVPYELLQARATLIDLQTQEASLSASILGAEQMSYEVQLKQLDISDKALSIAKEMDRTAAKELENRQKIENALSGRGAGTTEQQQIEAQITAAESAVDFAEIELELAKARLAVERLILDAKIESINAQIRTSNQNLEEGATPQELINKDTILQGFDKESSLTISSLTARVDAAKANLKGALIDAAFGGGGTSDPATQAFLNRFDQATLAAYRFKTALQVIKDEGGSTFDTVHAAVGFLREGMAPMLEDLRKLGPDGELVAAISEGSLTMMDSFTTLANSSSTTAEKIAAVGGIVSSLGSILAASSNAKIAAIDKEIAAEQKRDGKSKQSVEKIKALEKKKEAQQRKAFETNKKVQMAMAAINTAAAMVANVSAAAGAAAVAGPAAPAVFGATLAMLNGITLALGAAQIAIIAGTSFQGGGGTPSAGASTPTTLSIGKRQSTVDLAKTQSSAGEVSYLRGAQGMGGPENFTPAFMGAKYRAMGGATTGYVVGEQGPELFVPDRPGTVVPADETAQINSAPTNVNFTINAIDAAGVDEVITRQRGTIIGVIREAANSYGNEFLEAVDTGVYTPSSTGTRVYQGTK
jgi:hypothetical protein